MPDSRCRRRDAGFSLIEVLVVLVLAGLLMAFMAPFLDRYIHRGKIEGVTRQTATLFQVARIESLRGRAPSRVMADYDNDQVYAFVDFNRNGVLDAATDRELGRVPLPRGVAFWAEEDGEPEEANALITFDDDSSCDDCPRGGWEEYNTDGSARQTGAVRFGDQRGNFLEVRVTSAATGKVEIRKHDRETDAYWIQGEVAGKGKSWEWH